MYIGACARRSDYLFHFGQSERTVVLEIWGPYCEELNKIYEMKLVQGDVRAIPLKGRFELVFWWHGPEHLWSWDMKGAVAECERVCSGTVVIGCPWGSRPNKGRDNNPYQMHNSSHYPEEFWALGYKVATKGGIHEYVPDGGMIAWKRIS